MPYDVIGAVKKQFYLIKQLEERDKQTRELLLRESSRVLALRKEVDNLVILIGSLESKFRSLSRKEVNQAND